MPFRAKALFKGHPTVTDGQRMEITPLRVPVDNPECLEPLTAFEMYRQARHYLVQHRGLHLLIVHRILSRVWPAAPPRSPRVIWGPADAEECLCHYSIALETGSLLHEGGIALDDWVEFVAPAEADNGSRLCVRISVMPACPHPLRRVWVYEQSRGGCKHSIATRHLLPPLYSPVHMILGPVHLRAWITGL